MTSSSLDICDARKHLQPSKTYDECLQAMKEDLSAWFNELYGLDIDLAEANLLEYIDNGVLLCRHASAVNEKILKQVHDKTDPAVDQGVFSRTIPYRDKARPGSFHARDNIANFLTWCRAGLQLSDVITFETEDLVKHRNERNVVLCLLEVARRGGRHGMPVPDLVRLEMEIDEEVAAGENWNPEGRSEDGQYVFPDSGHVTTGAQAREGEDDDFEGRLVSSRKTDDPESEDEEEPVNSTEPGGHGVVNRFDDECTEQCASEAANSGQGLIEEQTGVQEQISEKKGIEQTQPIVQSQEICHDAASTKKSRNSDSAKHSRPGSARGQLKSSTAGQGQPPVAAPRRSTVIQVNMLTLDELVRKILGQCTCSTQFPMIRLSEGKYMFGENLTIIFVRVLRNHVMVRVGGGWDTLENYLSRHDPCRCHVHGTKGGTHVLSADLSSVSSQQASRSEAVTSVPRRDAQSSDCNINPNVDSARLALATQQCLQSSQRKESMVRKLSVKRADDDDLDTLQKSVQKTSRAARRLSFDSVNENKLLQVNLKKHPIDDSNRPGFKDSRSEQQDKTGQNSFDTNNPGTAEVSNIPDDESSRQHIRRRASACARVERQSADEAACRTTSTADVDLQRAETADRLRMLDDSQNAWNARTSNNNNSNTDMTLSRKLLQCADEHAGGWALPGGSEQDHCAPCRSSVDPEGKTKTELDPEVDSIKSRDTQGDSMSDEQACDLEDLISVNSYDRFSDEKDTRASDESLAWASSDSDLGTSVSSLCDPTGGGYSFTTNVTVLRDYPLLPNHTRHSNIRQSGKSGASNKPAATSVRFDDGAKDQGGIVSSCVKPQNKLNRRFSSPMRCTVPAHSTEDNDSMQKISNNARDMVSVPSATSRTTTASRRISGGNLEVSAGSQNNKCENSSKNLSLRTRPRSAGTARVGSTKGPTQVSFNKATVAARDRGVSSVVLSRTDSAKLLGNSGKSLSRRGSLPRGIYELRQSSLKEETSPYESFYSTGMSSVEGQHHQMPDVVKGMEGKSVSDPVPSSGSSSSRASDVVLDDLSDMLRTSFSGLLCPRKDNHTYDSKTRIPQPVLRSSVAK